MMQGENYVAKSVFKVIDRGDKILTCRNACEMKH